MISPARLMQAFGEAVIGVNQDGRIRYADDGACRMLGYKNMDDLLEKDIEQVLENHPGNASDTVHQCLEDVFQSGKPCGPITSHRIQLANGEAFNISYLVLPLDDTAVILLHREDEETGRYSLLHHASHDAMLNLPNRSSMQHALGRYIQSAGMTRRPCTLLLLDMDRFKSINDSYSHATGDEVLKAAVKAIKQNLRTGDLLGRWGGEEFIILLPNSNLADGVGIAERIRQQIAESPVLTTDGHKIDLSASIGVASFPEDATATADLLSIADFALSEAKRSGRNKVCSNNQGQKKVFNIASRIKQAVDKQLFTAAYQPIVNLATGEQCADEALARMVIPGEPPIVAGEFIETAEMLQLAHKIDHQLVKNTVRRCVANLMQGQSPLAHFVNISADLLRYPELVQDILDLIIQSCTTCFPDANPDTEKPLVIEITERELLEDIHQAKNLLKPFLDFGLNLAIDDFGSGYSSLMYLAELPVKYLKVEGQLVVRAREESKVRAILKGVQNLANELGLITIAESIENEETMNIMCDLGYHWGQGYYFGKPVLENFSLLDG